MIESDTTTQPSGAVRGFSSSRLARTTREMAAFVRAPTLAVPRASDPVGELARLFAINCAAVLVAALFLFPAMLLSETEMSGGMAAMFDRPAWQIFLIVVIAGPVMEELLFRHWLSGRAAWLIALAGIAAWVTGGWALREADAASTTASLVLGAAILVVVAGAVWATRRHGAPAWYARVFPLVFWAQALLFGFVHVFNYDGSNLALLLPFVLPQLIGGLIWGYARLRIGWWANTVMHMAYNLVAVAGVLVIGELAGI